VSTVAAARRRAVSGTSTGFDTGRLVRRLGFYAVVILILLPFLFVFYWMIINSFKPLVDAQAYPPKFFSFRPTLENYRALFQDPSNPFLKFTINSLIIASGATLLGLVLGLPAAYSIARYKQNGLGLVILTARIMPGISFLVPLYIVFSRAHLIDTYVSLIISHLIVTMPIIVWLMVGFFEDLPRELEEAARVDGASMFGTFWRISLPLSKAGIVASGILAFIFSWNNFMFSLVLTSTRTKTLPVAVFNFMGYSNINYGAISAAAAVITLPVIVLVLFVQRHIVQGLTAGGIKG
jgi:multiple sugar transport system permease protein